MGLATAIGLGVAGIGAFASSKSANKNSKRAAQVSQENNAANVALQREIYGQNKQILSPFVERGNAAGGALNALLGLGGAPAQQQTQQVQPNALSQFQPTAAAQWGLADGMSGYNPALARDMSPITSSNFNISGGGMVPNGQQTLPTAQPNVMQQTGAVSAGQTAQEAQNAAFDNFRNSTGYKFRLGEGMNALNSGYAGAGVLQSGDAMRAALEYGQNFASNEFGNYAGMLQTQQAVGAGAGSSLAGVGQNFANSVSAQNTMNAANQANAITSRQNPLANMAGMIGGGLFSYGTGPK